MIIIAVILFVASALAFAISKSPVVVADNSWDGYIDNSSSAQRVLGKAAKSLNRVPVIQSALKDKTQYKNIQRDLKIGGAFSGSLEIYLSMQLLGFFIATAIFCIALLATSVFIIKILLLLSGFVMLYWPYNEVKTRAQKRSAVIASELPDFAEMLIMVLPTMSIPQSISFVCEYLKGTVATELKSLVKTLSTGTLNQEEAFNLTAERLGTNDGKAFVDALRDSHIDGTKVVENITNLANNMRIISYQNQRATLKKLPTKLSLIFAMHFMPMIFILAFLPVVASLSSAVR